MEINHKILENIVREIIQMYGFDDQEENAVRHLRLRLHEELNSQIKPKTNG